MAKQNYSNPNQPAAKFIKNDPAKTVGQALASAKKQVEQAKAK
jgi:hypothetical protein